MLYPLSYRGRCPARRPWHGAGRGGRGAGPSLTGLPPDRRSDDRGIVSLAASGAAGGAKERWACCPVTSPGSVSGCAARCAGPGSVFSLSHIH